MESILCSCISVCHGSCSLEEKKALLMVVKAAQRNVESTFSTTTMGHLHQQMQEPGPTQPGCTLFLPLEQESAQHQEQNHQTKEQLLPGDCWTLVVLSQPQISFVLSNAHKDRIQMRILETRLTDTWTPPREAAAHSHPGHLFLASDLEKQLHLCN